MGMIERRQHLRFAPEPPETIGVAREGVGDDFQRDIAAEIRVTGAVDLTHPSCSEQGDDLVRTKFVPRAQRHRTALARVYTPSAPHEPT